MTTFRRGQCMKCYTTILVASAQVQPEPDPEGTEEFDDMLVIYRTDFYPRHDGHPLVCPFHPGMTYYLYDRGEVEVDLEDEGPAPATDGEHTYQGTHGLDCDAPEGRGEPG